MLGIIPAAGKGSRFKELGKIYQKSVLPYKEKPLIIHQIEYLEKICGKGNVVVVLNHQYQETENVLKMYSKNVTISYQTELNGLSGAVLSALEKNDKHEDILIVLGDIIIETDPKDIDFSDNFVSYMNVQDYSRWCLIKTDNDNNIIKFFDKPKEDPETRLAISGVYYIKQSDELKSIIENQIKNNEKIASEFQISSALSKICENHKIKSKILDIKDFGTIEEYLKNRNVNISRSFNTVEFTSQTCKKSSEKSEKIVSEVSWFKNIPYELAQFTPRLLDYNFFGDICSYTMEKITCPTLRDVFMFLDSSKETWSSIFKSCKEVLDVEVKYGKKNEFLKSIVQKTRNRTESIKNDPRYSFIDFDLTKKFINKLDEVISETDDIPCVMHGDFCFSNLMYDFGKSKIIMIDPRGELFGSLYYELAKLMHSAIYHYDFIDAELYSINKSEIMIYDKNKEDVEQEFWKFISDFNVSATTLKFICASLFISMIPLHNHSEINQHLFYNVFKNIVSDLTI